MRNAEIDPLTGDIVRMRIGSRMDAFAEVLRRGLPPGRETSAALRLALSIHTWRSLVTEEGLSLQAAVEFMLRAIDCAGRKSRKSAKA